MKFLCFLLFSFYCFPSLSERLILSLAEKALLPLPSHQIRVGNKSLLAIQTEQGKLSLLARKEGQTLLSIGNIQYEIFIFNKEKKLKALMLNQLLKKFWGLDWSISEENTFQITGTLHRLSDWLELAKNAKDFKISYQFKALPGEGLEKTIQYYFKQIFNNKTPIEIVWPKLPVVYIPQGADLLEYEKKLQAFGLIPKEDPLWLFTAPLIEIEIALVENLKSSGFSFGGQAESNKSLLDFSSLLHLLNFLKDSGRGKTLHHSVVNVQSGQKLQIQSGGQIPFSNYNLKTEQKSTDWKSHGLNLRLSPKLGKKNQIKLNIKAQVSEPMAFPSGDSPPPLKTQSLENTVVLKEKQILPVFQLSKESKGRQSQGHIGILSDFPYAFLSGNRYYQTKQVIFIQAQRADQKESNVAGQNLSEFISEKFSKDKKKEKNEAR